MTTEVAVRNHQDYALTSKAIPTDHEMMVYNTMAKQAVDSKMYKGIGDQAGVMMIMLSARELGIPPMQALNGGIHIIQGKVEISARMMSALIRKAGHQITIKESTDNLCTLVGKRSDSGETSTSSFSYAEAQKAGLVKPGGGWSKWPKDMCFARALSRLSRQLFSDVIGIGYVEGEIIPVESEVITKEDRAAIPELLESEPTEQVDLLPVYLEQFDPLFETIALEYLQCVQDHFEWHQEKAIEEMIKDKDKLQEKFKSWLDRKQKEQK